MEKKRELDSCLEERGTLQGERDRERERDAWGCVEEKEDQIKTKVKRGEMVSSAVFSFFTKSFFSCAFESEAGEGTEGSLGTC